MELVTAPPKKKIVLAICTWSDVKTQTFLDIVNLVSMHNFDRVIASTGSLLPECRNVVTNVAFMVEQKEREQLIAEHGKVPDNYENFTHILYLDADMCGVTTDIVRCLEENNCDIVAPIMVTRYPPFAPAIPSDRLPILANELVKPPEQRQLVDVGSVGLACTLVSRKVLEKTMELINGAPNWFLRRQDVRSTFDDEVKQKKFDVKLNKMSPDEAYDYGLEIGLTGHVGGTFYGEDFSFCKKAVDLGFTVHMDPRLSVKHIGECPYDIDDYVAFSSYLETHKKLPDARLQCNIGIWNTKKS